MKKIFFVLALCALTTTSMFSQDVKRIGNTFVAEKKVKAKGEKSAPIATGYKYTDTDGKTYDVYQRRAGGSCFINRISKKTGKPYPKYLPKHVSQTINNELKGGRK